jgi:hypothetical protein
MTDEWRTEADDEWLAAHRSDNFARMRRRLKQLGLVGDAVSNAEMGPFGGSPRKPQLKIGGKAYAVVRYVEHRISYTTISVELDRCPRCGSPLAERHRLVRVGPEGGRTIVGVIRACRRCDATSWLFRSRMPASRRGRRRDRKAVL